MTPWIVFVAIGLGTYAMRAGMFMLLGDRSLPAWTETPFSLVAPAAIGALVASMVFTSNGNVDIAGAPELIAIGGAFLITRRTGNVMHAIGVGLPLYWLASFAFN